MADDLVEGVGVGVGSGGGRSLRGDARVGIFKGRHVEVCCSWNCVVIKESLS